jgi:nicotinamide-nucleotide amidase
MSIWPKDIEEAAQTIVTDFAARGLLIATAESCTAGLIAGAITEISGSSNVFDRGFVTYSNEAKREMIASPMRR